MGNFFSGLTAWNVLFAASIAYILTYLIFYRQKQREMKKKNLNADGSKLMDLGAVMVKCKELFPIDTIYFHGRVFKRGMRIRITTLQKKVIEGELIGKNKVDLICVKTKNHIIAHEIEKIEDITVTGENPMA